MRMGSFRVAQYEVTANWRGTSVRTMLFKSVT